MRSAVPSIKAAKVRQALQSGALDIEGKGWDRDSGGGIASAMNALRDAGGKPAVFIELASVSVAPASGDVLVPGVSASLQLSLINNGGAPASAVKGTLTSSTPGVTVTQSLSSYPNLAAGASASAVTAFAIQVGAGVPCGTRLAFELAVTFTGAGTSPKTLSFTLQSGRPASTPTRFSYTGPAVSIPDGELLGVDVPLVVSGIPTISRLAFRFDGDACTNADGATTVGLDHTYVGDLAARLISPSGTPLTLMDRPGFFFNSGNNFCQTVLDDAGGLSIQAVSATEAPYTGVYMPAFPAQTFNGESANGTWTLNVSDLAFGDLGNVRAFSLDITGYDCAGP
jgi:subtilisin-like proprotein convertase family protein